MDASSEMLVDEILSSRLNDSGGRDETESVSQEEYLVWAVSHPSLPSDFLKLLTQVSTFSHVLVVIVLQ